MGWSKPILDRLRLSHPDLARRLEAAPTVVRQEPVPFWTRHLVYEVKLIGPQPMTLYFADDGVHLVRLRGGEDLALVNRREGLRLAPQHAEPYVRFYLQRGGVLGLRLLERADEFEWLRDAGPGRRAAAEGAVRPIRVVLLPEGGYAATALGLLEEDLVELQLQVRGDGNVREQGRRVLEAGLPVEPLLR